MTTALTVYFSVTTIIFLYLSIAWASDSGKNIFFKMLHIVLCVASFYFLAVHNHWPLFPNAK